MSKTIDLTKDWDGKVTTLNKALYVYIYETGEKPKSLIMNIRQLIELEAQFLDSIDSPLAEYRGIKIELTK